MLTTALAEAIDRIDTGPYASVKFSSEDIRELRYAALLHDFGKVGVRERVLVKANKLDDHAMDQLVARFKFIRKALETDFLQRKLSVILTVGRTGRGTIEALDEELQRRLAKLDEQLLFIQQANKPTVLPSGGFERILEIATQNFTDADGTSQPYLHTEEAENLTISKGSLSREERLEIESHATHSFRFLRQIPWTKDLRRIPAIAYSHHEKLNGGGYPNGLRGDDIPLQGRMMAVCDVYDALTASDRPYKPALPPEKALAILRQDAEAGGLDAELVRIFTDSRAWAQTQGLRPGG
jgi:response regulator RpfG family c-di-GMP phosphodiesterase